jgi:protein-S-isoprenylcysteine O-methyltransferase Ste14
MAHAPAPPAPPPKITPVTHTTKRGFATASFCLGLWGCLTFWWYPFGLCVAGLGTLFAMVSIVMGWRAGKDGEHLAWLGLLFGGSGVGAAIAAYRFVQLAFEETPPPLLAGLWPF